MMVRETVEGILRKVAPDADHIEVTVPEHAQFGHFSTNVALRLAKVRGKAPIEVAKDIAERIGQEAPVGFFEKIEAVNPGFVNLWLSAKAIQGGFKEIVEANGSWGRPSPEAAEGAKTVVIDYSAPNIAKPMGVGHLRSTVIGQALYNVFKFAGWHAIGDNHLGDWGKQFGVLIAAYKEDGSSEEVSIEYLTKLYVDYSARMKEHSELGDVARAEVKKLQDGDEENVAIWRKFHRISLEEFQKMYDLLGVSFDQYLGESFYNNDLARIVDDAMAKGVAVESEGAIVIPTEGHPAPMIVRKSDGAYLYPTTDLATIKYRIREFKADKILYVVGNEQSLHFEQLFAAARKLGMVAGQELVHVKFGLMLGEDMKKFSTRAGKTVSLFGLLQEAIARARKVVDEKQADLPEADRARIAQAVGIGAVKYNDLSQNRQSDIVFDWERMLNFEGNSGPYLQYTYARLKSILRKAEAEFGGMAMEVQASDIATLVDESELQVILRLDEFPHVIARVMRQQYPHYIADYCYALAKDINAMYQKMPVLKVEPAERNARLALIAAAAQTLKTSLELLGVEALEQM